MKLVGHFMLLAILMYVMSTEAAKPSKTKGMAEGQNDWKGKRLRTDENMATYARQTTREQKVQPKESRESKKLEKRHSSEDTHPESFEEQLNQAVNNYKLIKQKTQRKYSEESNLGRESSIKKTRDNSAAYRKKTNSKEEEENVKETEDIYEAVSNSNKGRKSSAINKREPKEEKPLENVRVKKPKPTIVEEDCPEKYVVSQTNKHKGFKKNSECEHSNSYQTSKSDYKLSKKQSKNKPEKKEKTSKKYSEKTQDDYENIQEEDSRRTKTWKKQHRMKYEDIDDDDDVQTREELNQMYRKQKRIEDNNNSEDFSEEKLMSKKKYDEEDEENQHFKEEMKYSQSKYRPTCEDRFQEEEVDDNESVGSENLVEENNNRDEEEITIEEQNMETNGRINVGKRENTVETKKGPEGLVSELYNEIDNLEPSKETKLKVLKKYMLLEMNNEEYQNEEASVTSTNIEDTLDRPNTKEELNSNLNTYMYIVEEEFKGHQIRYAVEEDNGDVRYRLSEETDEVSS